MNNDQNAQNGNSQQENTIEIQITAQYVKDLSFENPKAPEIFNTKEHPTVDVRLDVTSMALENGIHEVTLSTTVSGKSSENPLFVAELSYCGLFTILGVPDQHLRAILLIECPRLLFPFVRNIISDFIRDGCYPPFMMQPVDFAQLYQQSLKSQTSNLSN